MDQKEPKLNKPGNIWCTVQILNVITIHLVVSEMKHA